MNVCGFRDVVGGLGGSRLALGVDVCLGESLQGRGVLSLLSRYIYIAERMNKFHHFVPMLVTPFPPLLALPLFPPLLMVRYLSTHPLPPDFSERVVHAAYVDAYAHV